MKEKIVGMDILYDKSFRKALKENPKANIGELGYDLDDSIEIVVKTNTKETFYITISASQDVDLENINAAGAAGTISTVASASTAATVSSTVSTGGSAGCVGSASSN